MSASRTCVFAVWYEPTDADKACKPFLSESWKALTYTSPNLAELCTMNRTLGLPTPTGAYLFLSPVHGSCTDGDGADKHCGEKQPVVEEAYIKTCSRGSCESTRETILPTAYFRGIYSLVAKTA